MTVILLITPGELSDLLSKQVVHIHAEGRDYILQVVPELGPETSEGPSPEGEEPVPAPGGLGTTGEPSPET